jgi:hypothetical protein
LWYLVRYYNITSIHRIVVAAIDSDLDRF